MDLFEKSQLTLELPAVLDLLAAEAASAPAREMARALRPSIHRGEVERMLAETSAAKDMMVSKGSPSFSGVKDVRNALARADMGGVLNTRELLEIAGVLQAARVVRSYGMSAEKSSCIDHLFRTLQANKFLEEKILVSIPAEDEIANLVARAKACGSAVVGTFNAISNPGQLALIRALVDSGIPTAAVALRVPYDLRDLPEEVWAIAAYEYSPESISAAAKVLRGELQPIGKLPVQL